MGLFKKIADYRGEAHGVDPLGHDHTKSQITDFPVYWDADHVIWSPSGTQDFTAGEMFEELAGNVSELRTELGGKADVVEFISVRTSNPLSFSELDDITKYGVYKGVVSYNSGAATLYWGAILRVNTTRRGQVIIVIQELEYDGYKYNRTKVGLDPWGAWSAVDDTIYIEDVKGLEQALNGKANKTHNHYDADILCITGEYPEGKPLDEVLYNMDAALDGKLDSSVTALDVSSPVSANSLINGKLYYIINNNNAKLNELIVGGAGYVYFHLNSGDLENSVFLIRKYTIASQGHYFIEVVGAWDVE